MFEKFQKSAKVAVVLSQEEAREMDESRIGAEHVLVGVLDSA
ncbi:Clp protease, partial [Mycobacteroides chelonae]